ncbi:helix-turn-helix transcriptional regulator [Actinospica sp. MGRD01-02]|uniref:Helix-turn-helix transcriptional regulator n=1 Tax=Actinospica acidithermotolerans TaxID=2828514 RepID=A0A941EBC1_9ACTN|nr:PadR family transcriptional regulator [Actinospica acidithermotolerans]MBR7828421.1 helix-turn-helix transcriptional regulator [Actinospica acidithermotolerans]
MRKFDSGLEGPHPERRGRGRGGDQQRRRGEREEGFGPRGRHGHHMHGGFPPIPPGGPQFGGPDFGFGPGPGPFGGPRGRGRGRGRAGRGDVRAAIISLLSEQPRNGYQIIQEINERTGGLWRVSSGSVYPAISQLEDEGLIEPTDGDGRKLFALTEAGRAHAEENADQLARLWEAGAGDSRFTEFLRYRELMGQLVAATRQVNEVGTAAQREEAKQVLIKARQALYKILAADPADDEAEPVDEA